MRRLNWFGFAAAFAATLALFAPHAGAQGKKDSVVISIPLEPPGLDPTVAPASAIAEVTHINIFEGLVKLNENGTFSPLLADSWSVAADGKTWTFKLKNGVKFQDGTAFDSADVKYSFTLYGSAESKNKRKNVFVNIDAIETPDPLTVVIKLKNVDAIFLQNMSEATAVITAPESAATNATQPVGTGPYKLENWVKGDSVTLTASPTFRTVGSFPIKTVKIRFIADPAATIAALLAGDIDAAPYGLPGDDVARFEKDKRFKVVLGSTEGETMVIINNKRKPFDDVRVRRALSYAIDKQAALDAAFSGHGTLIGSHFPPHHPAYVDLTKQYAYDPNKAKALLKEAGVTTPLEVTLRLPPPAYARRSGEVVQAMLAQVGINAKIENLEWAQWLDSVFKSKNFDLSIVSHVEPNDIVSYTNPDYYWQYDSAEFRDIMAKANSTVNEADRNKLLQQAQRKLADDAVNVFMYSMPRIGYVKAGLAGYWKNAPIVVNDFASWKWN